MTFKVGDVARIVRANTVPVKPYLQPYIGQVVEIIGLNSRASEASGSYHWVQAGDGRAFHTAVTWLQKIEPPREDLQVVSWEDLPWWQPTVAA